MTNDLIPLLAKFHREVLLPDIDRVVGQRIGELRQEMNARFREVDGHFDAIYKRFDRLETEYQMLLAGLKRVEAS